MFVRHTDSAGTLIARHGHSLFAGAPIAQSFLTTTLYCGQGDIIKLEGQQNSTTTLGYNSGSSTPHDYYIFLRAIVLGSQ